MSLPAEIIFSILEHVYYLTTSDDRLITTRDPDYRTLSACSLIERRWRTPAQSLLFNHITGNAAHRLIKCFTAGSSEHLEALMKHIRILDVSMAYNHHLPLEHPGITSTEFMIFMEHVPNLYELGVSVSRIISLKATLANLKNSSPVLYPTHLKALRIVECSVQSHILYELLDFFPTVEFLKVQVEIVVPPPSTPANFHLYELSMSRTLSTEITTWLLSASHNSLRILELRDLPSAGVCNLLVQYGRQLQSFRAMRYNMNTAKLLEACRNLQELVILGLPTIPTLAVEKLPPTLEHFSLVHRHSDPGMDIADVMVLVTTLSNLKLLTFDHKLKDDPQYELFSDICVKKGIEVQSSVNGSWPNDEPVKVSRFPRKRTTLNFRTMNQDC